MTKLKNIAFTAATIMVSAFGISARPSNRSHFSKQPLTVIYIGDEDNYLLFKVIVNSVDTNNASFEISDRIAGSIYAANMNYTHKVETLKIGKRNNQELDFKLRIGKDVYSRSFAIL